MLQSKKVYLQQMKFTANIIFLLLLTICLGTKQAPKEVITKSGLRYTVVKEGVGEAAKTGQEVAIYESMGYVGAKPFYSIERPAQPIHSWQKAGH